MLNSYVMCCNVFIFQVLFYIYLSIKKTGLFKISDALSQCKFQLFTIKQLSCLKKRQIFLFNFLLENLRYINETLYIKSFWVGILSINLTSSSSHLITNINNFWASYLSVLTKNCRSSNLAFEINYTNHVTVGFPFYVDVCPSNDILQLLCE